MNPSSAISFLPDVFVVFERATVNGENVWYPTHVTASLESAERIKDNILSALPVNEVVIRRCRA